MSNYRNVYDQSMAGINAAMVEEQANFQKATITGDVEEQVRASQAIAGFRTLADSYHKMASEHANSMQAPLMDGDSELSHRDSQLARHYNLSPGELSIAKAWTSDPAINDEDRVREYVQNRRRYQRMRATGQYRDDQGRVTR
jgi:hypothetical protein